MILAAHQPNYLPWAGFFRKMARCDVFVLLDSVQYARRSYTARCLIKQSDGAKHWMSVPVRKKGRYYQKIAEVGIDSQDPWQHDHRRTLESNYAKAPYFDRQGELLELAYGRPWEGLCEMNISLIRHLAGTLGIVTRLVRLSELAIDSQSTELLVEICKKTGADNYLSGPSGGKYLDRGLFAKAGVNLEMLRYWPDPYPQLWGGFAPGLSIVDLLFNCGPQAARKELGLEQ